MSGRVVNSYRLVSRLGAGGMGEVYLARDTRRHRDVALKVLPYALAADADQIARFKREAQSARENVEEFNQTTLQFLQRQARAGIA